VPAVCSKAGTTYFIKKVVRFGVFKGFLDFSVQRRPDTRTSCHYVENVMLSGQLDVKTQKITIKMWNYKSFSLLKRTTNKKTLKT